MRNSRPSSRSPTGRGTPLNGVRRRFEACREHDAWHKAMRKRNIANPVVSADHARKEGGKRGCLCNNNIPKKRITSFGKGLSLFLNRSRHPPCSRSSADQSRRVLTLWSWVRIPPGALIHTNTSTSLFLRVDQWSSGRAVECDCPESSRGASPRRFESSLLRDPRMKIVPMRGLSRFGRCAPY